MDNILDKIISATIARHAGMPSDEYVKELGREGCDEKTCVREGKIALMNAILKSILLMDKKLDIINETISMIKGEGENG